MVKGGRDTSRETQQKTIGEAIRNEPSHGSKLLGKQCVETSAESRRNNDHARSFEVVGGLAVADGGNVSQ